MFFLLNYFGHRSNQQDDIFKLLQETLQSDKIKKKWHCCYDLFSGSASMSIEAMRLDLAERYVINDAYHPLTLFWQTVKENPEQLNEAYQKILRDYCESTEDRLLFYQNQQQLFNKEQANFQLPDTNNSVALVQQMARFAFIINHAEYGIPTIKETKKGQLELVCQLTQNSGELEIDRNFKDAALSLAELFRTHEVEFTCHDFISYQDKITTDDLVFLEPPYPDMEDAEENSACHIYHRTEPKSQLHKNICDFLGKLKESNTTYLLFYGVQGMKNIYPMVEENRFLRITGGSASAFGEYIENLYLSENLSRMISVIYPPHIIRWDLHIDALMAEKSYQELVPLIREQLVSYGTWNNPFHRLFEEQAEKKRFNIALVYFDDTKVERETSYEELNSEINQLAHFLIEKNIGKGDLIAIFVDEDMGSFITHMLAVLKTGAAYVPINTKYAPAVIQETLNDAMPTLILSQRPLETLQLNLLQPLIITEQLNLESYNTDNPVTSKTVYPHDLAYVMYTSGSTGKPKGVAICHRGLPYCLRAHQLALQFDDQERIAQMAQVGFDASVMEIMMAMGSGVPLYLIPPSIRDDNFKLTQVFNENNITQAILVPSKLRGLKADDLPKLKGMVVTGEKFDEQLIEPWYKVKKIIINGYGATEDTICSTLGIYSGAGISIGGPIIGKKIYLLEPMEKAAADIDFTQLRMVAEAEIGELYVSGVGLAQGYWHDEAKTRQSFVNIKLENGEMVRAYRTKDLAVQVSGKEEYLIRGRVDNQVKLRGQRLEPEHIEEWIKQYQPNGKVVIENACVVAVNDNLNVHLVAYLQLANTNDSLTDNEQLILFNQLREFLKKHLPHFMIPNAIGRLDALPLNRNDKIDRNALKLLSPIPYLHTAIEEMPMTQAERTLADIWGDVLGYAPGTIRRFDDFFCLGGSSLLVSSLLNELRRFPVTFLNAPALKPEDIYQCSSLKRIARRASATPIKQLHKGKKSYPVIVLVHSILGDGWTEYDSISDALKNLKCAIYALQAPALTMDNNFDNDIEDLATDYVLALQLEEIISAERSVIFMGWSSGGLIAYEMVQQLKQRNYPTNLVLIDSTVPSLIEPFEVQFNKLTQLLNDKLGPEFSRAHFQQLQYNFAKWLFKAEYEYISRNTSNDSWNFPDKTLLLIASETNEETVLGHRQVKRRKNINADHFSIIQTRVCCDLIVSFCEEIIEDKKPVFKYSRLVEDLLTGFVQTQQISPYIEIQPARIQPAMFDDEEPTYSEPTISLVVDDIETTSDGKQAYHAVVQGICALIECDQLPESFFGFYEKLSVRLGLVTNNREGILKWLSEHKKICDWVALIQPALRQIAIAYIEVNYDGVYGACYRDLIWNIYQDFIEKNIEKNLFYLSSTQLDKYIFDKFNSVKSLSQRDLAKWWDELGNSVYFALLKESARLFYDQAHWGSKLEIAALAACLSINIIWNKPEFNRSQLETTTPDCSKDKHEASALQEMPKAFRTVETGEAYQPIRIAYIIQQQDKLIERLNTIACCKKRDNGNVWDWFWSDECDDLDFRSIDNYQKNPMQPPRLGIFTIRDEILYLNLPSFKRACLGVKFFYQILDPTLVTTHRATFINKVFGLDEHLPQNFSEFFQDDFSEELAYYRLDAYEKVQERVGSAANADEKVQIMSEYTNSESRKPLPFTETYLFALTKTNDPDLVFLGFYIYLRGRELVAIRRWFGATEYTLADAAEETVREVYADSDYPLEDTTDSQPTSNEEIEQLRNRVQSNPEDSHSWLKIADHYLDQGDLEQAIPYYVNVTLLSPNNVSAHHNLGYIYHIRDDYPLAEHHFNQALQIENRNIVFCDYGLFLLNQQRLEQAAENFLAALVHDKNYQTIAFPNSGRKILDQYLQQEITAKQELQAKPFIMAHYWLVQCFYNLNDFELTQFYLNKLAEITQRFISPKNYRILSYAYRLVGNENEADEYFALAVSVEGLDAEKEKQQNLNGNQLCFRELTEFVENDPTALRYHILGYINRLIGEGEKAEEYDALAFSLGYTPEPIAKWDNVKPDYTISPLFSNRVAATVMQEPNEDWVRGVISPAIQAAYVRKPNAKRNSSFLDGSSENGIISKVSRICQNYFDSSVGFWRQNNFSQTVISSTVLSSKKEDEITASNKNKK